MKWQCLGALLVLAAVGCNKHPAIIHYQQRMNFNVYDPDPAAQPHQTYGGGYSVFYVSSIENPAQGTTYHFKPADLYLSSPSFSGWNLEWAYTLSGVPWRAGDKTVAAGATANNVGCVIVQTTSEDAGKYVYYLNSSGGDPVLPVRDGNTTPVENVGTAYPQTLSSHCQP